MTLCYNASEIWHMADVIDIFHFEQSLALLPHLQPKKWKKCLVISSFNTSAPKIMIICYIAPEIWYMADVIVIFHFVLFLPFYPPSSPKSENFKTMKKTPGDIIILQKCTKTLHHMLYCSWDIWCVMDVIANFYFGLFFALSLP